MQTITLDGVRLYCDLGEQDAVAVLRPACEKSVAVIQSTWHLPLPEDCRVYVMTHWLRFMFRAAPWSWWPSLTVTLPFWGLRARKLWPYIGGWAQRFGRRRAVGLKPPRLYRLSDRSLGRRIFVKEDDVLRKVAQTACHELTHAFTAHLKLPAWLNEGLAMVTVDHYVGRPTVQAATLDVLVTHSRLNPPASYRKLRFRQPDALVYLYVRGYWIVRYLTEAYPVLLPTLLAERRRPRELEARIAAALDLDRVAFWQAIDRRVADHFGS